MPQGFHVKSVSSAPPDTPSNVACTPAASETLSSGEGPESAAIGVMAMYQRKADEGVKRHVVVDRDEAASKIFELIEYRLEVNKK